MREIIGVVTVLLLLACPQCKKQDTINTAANCNDGKRNGNETDVDCGGNCVACPILLGIVSKVKTQSRSFNDYIENYMYDSLGRIVLIQNTYKLNGVNSRKQTFTYTPTAILNAVYDSAASAPWQVQTWAVDSQGLLVSMDSLRTFRYDLKGHLVSQTYPDIIYEWSNGNMTQYHWDPVIYTCTYLADRIESRNFGRAFEGKGSKNLISTLISGGITTAYTYQFDLQDRVIKQINAGGTGSEITYTYY